VENIIKMSQLSAQSIYALCQDNRIVHKKKPGFWNNSFLLDSTIFVKYEKVSVPQIPMIYPFEPEKKIAQGKSYGLSSASYDCRIKEDLTLGPIGSETCCGLAHTIEKFCIPDNVCGYVLDKSSYARVFVSALNTLFDPGFSGFLEDGSMSIDPETGLPTPYASAVLELVNFGKHEIFIPAGSPICQFAFHWLDEPTDRPYRGKYSGQVGAQPAIYEKDKDLETGPNLSSLKDD